MQNRIQFEGNDKNEFLKIVYYSTNEFSDEEHTFIKKIKISDQELYNESKIISTVKVLETPIENIERRGRAHEAV